jgi:hypothetical protein
MSGSSKHLTPERLKIISETAAVVAEKVVDGTIPTRFYEKMLGENPELRAYFRSLMPGISAASVWLSRRCCQRP